jgi:hypothetical protein
MPFLLTSLTMLALCFLSAGNRQQYRWESVTDSAAYPEGYNYPVYVFGDRMVALNNGAWMSRDGKDWTKTELPDSGLNSAYQKYVQFNGAIYALGSLTGNYERFAVTPKILKTTDFKKWETVAETSNLPQRVFYGLLVFDNKMWMLGGFDGSRYHNDVWNSPDGVTWKLVAKSTAWSPRNAVAVTVFKDRIWLIGGGVIDGDRDPNPNSRNEIWSSADGIDWRREATRISENGRYAGGSVAVWDDKLWLVGVNRGNEFQSGVMSSDDGKTWSEMKAPWSPRGAVAVWTFGGKLWMTGGKSSHVENGEIKFVYSNDVWAMSRKTE